MIRITDEERLELKEIFKQSYRRDGKFPFRAKWKGITVWFLNDYHNFRKQKQEWLHVEVIFYINGVVYFGVIGRFKLIKFITKRT